MAIEKLAQVLEWARGGWQPPARGWDRGILISGREACPGVLWVSGEASGILSPLSLPWAQARLTS